MGTANLHIARLTGTVSREKDCEGSGQPLDSTMAIMFGVGRCPVCRGLVNTDSQSGLIEPHTVYVIDFGEDDE